VFYKEDILSMKEINLEEHRCFLQ